MTWEPLNNRDGRVVAGTYFVRLECGGKRDGIAQSQRLNRSTIALQIGQQPSGISFSVSASALPIQVNLLKGNP